METKSQIDTREILQRLVKLQADMNYIKEHMILEKEMREWEEAGAEDSADFFEKHNL